VDGAFFPGGQNPFVRWGTINTSLQKILNTQKFGDMYSVTQKEEAIINDFLLSRYPVLKDVSFKIGKVPDPDSTRSIAPAAPGEDINPPSG
jgi:hypothetical protein